MPCRDDWPSPSQEQAAKIAAHKCPMCEQPIGEFRDELSVKEYEISGLCQSCQDDFFGNVYVEGISSVT